MLDRCDQKGDLGGVVVQLGSPGDPCPAADLSAGRAVKPLGHEAIDGGVERKN